MNKLNWFQKIASVSFRIQGSDKIGQPKSIDNLANDLLTWAETNYPAQFKLDFYAFISSDGGGDPYLPLGIINWYFDENIDPQRIKPFVEKAIEDTLHPLGIKTGPLRDNRSGLMKNLRVWRIPVLENPTTQREKLPHLNMTNDNFVVLFDLLNLPHQTFNGQIDAYTLKDRIAKSRYKVDAFARSEKRDTSVDPETGEVSVNTINYELSANQLNVYLNRLDQMADRAMRMNSRMIIWD